MLSLAGGAAVSAPMAIRPVGGSPLDAALQPPVRPSFGNFLAEYAGVPTEYTCEVDLSQTCKSGGVDGPLGDPRYLLLAPKTQVILYGSSHMKQLGVAIVEAHRYETQEKMNGDLDQLFFANSVEGPDCDGATGNRMDSILNGTQESIVVDEVGSGSGSGIGSGQEGWDIWEEVRSEEDLRVDGEYLCNRAKYGNTPCVTPMEDSFVRYTFKNGAMLTMITNYGRLMRTSGQARLTQLLPKLRVEGYRNVALVQTPHVDQYFEEQCKKEKDPSYQPQKLPVTFDCVDPDHKEVADAVEYAKCLMAMPFYQSLASQAAWLETKLVVPWMYATGLPASDNVYELGKLAQLYRCSYDDVSGELGKGLDYDYPPGSHLCMVVCEESSDQCSPGPIIAMIADMLTKFRVSLTPVHPRNLVSDAAA